MPEIGGIHLIENIFMLRNHVDRLSPYGYDDLCCQRMSLVNVLSRGTNRCNIKVSVKTSPEDKSKGTPCSLPWNFGEDHRTQ